MLEVSNPSLLVLYWDQRIYCGMSQKFHGIQPKLTFREFGVQVVVSQFLKNNMEMFRMIFRILGVDQNVIKEDHNKFVEFLHKDRVHEIHEICWGIGKTK
jgi:hypothetical protein